MHRAKMSFVEPNGLWLRCSGGLRLCCVLSRVLLVNRRQLCLSLPPWCAERCEGLVSTPSRLSLGDDTLMRAQDGTVVIRMFRSASDTRTEHGGENSGKFHNPKRVLNYTLSTRKDTRECSDMWTPSDSPALPASLEYRCPPGVSCITV